MEGINKSTTTRTSVLITGVAGFIGSNLAEALIEKGYTVVGLDNFDPFYDKSIKIRNLQSLIKSKDFFFIEGSLNDTEMYEILAGNFDVVIHLAAKAGVQPSLSDPVSYLDNNVKGTNILLEWMRRKNIRKFIFASSSSVYGNSASVPFEESGIVNAPISPYAFSKASCELLNYTYHYLYKMDVINLRLFTVFGERQRPDLAIHKFVRQIFAGEPIVLNGDGSSARDYTYISDIVNGLLAAINYVLSNSCIYENINLGNNKPVSLMGMVNVIKKNISIQPQLIFGDKKPGDVEITCANIEKAGNLLGYNPQVSFEQGIKKFVDWYTLQNEYK